MSSFDSLSEKQKEIVFNKSGKFVVRACPGSGKTYTVSAKLAYLIRNWEDKYKGIATLSFTNVAWEEIEKYLNNKFSIYTPVNYPHFLGTIDSFINKYIFLPFGHLILECECRPTLVGNPHGTWTGFDYSSGQFDNITFDIEGNPYAINPMKLTSNWQENNPHILRAKKRLLKTGYANQSDANYFSLEILKNYPSVAKSLVKRFPNFILDEAQDTTQIQMEIIETLQNHGLNQIMLVGDYDQAIFEWNKARPELLMEKFKEWEQNSITLNENWRSSTNICQFTFHFSTLSESSRAVNEEVSNYDAIPKIVSYKDQSYQSVIDQFLDECRQRNIEISKENIAILCRSKSLLDEIIGNTENNSTTPWKTGKLYVKDIVFGKYLIDKGNFKKGYKKVERGLYKAIYNSHYCSRDDIKELVERIGIVGLRTCVHKFTKSLPSTNNLTVGEWTDEASSAIDSNEYDISLEIKPSRHDVPLSNLFSLSTVELELDYTFGTVHSVKGETFDATLLFLKKSGGKGKHYKTLLNEGATTKDSEELRIVYVAITRPRKLLTVAVPDEENLNAWNNRRSRLLL